MSGIAQLQARQLARKGRYGDDAILHVSRGEIAGLDALARHMYGRNLPRNPETGQKEAFLFLPMLLPMLASTGALGAGMAALAGSTLGAAALGAGAGTLEAAARGMDDPLKHGLMSGITAGAGSMLGSGISAAGGNAGAESLAGAMGGDAQTAGMLAENIATGANPMEAGTSYLSAVKDTSPLYEDMPFAKSALQAPTAMDAVQASAAQYGTGVKNLLTDPNVAKTFLENPNTLKGVIGMTGGAMGQDQLAQVQKAEEADEARGAESEAKYQQGVSKIKQAYADAGRAPWWNDPNRLRDFGVSYNYADGGPVFPMQSGGFVVPKYAVDAVGAGSNEKGLAALKRHVQARPIRGNGTGTSDSIPAKIDGTQPARVSNGEAYVNPKNVEKAGGSAQFYQMLNAVKKSRARRA